MNITSGNFFSQFLMLTDIRTIIFIAILILLFSLIWKMTKIRFKFTSIMLIATGLGLILGVIIQLVAGFPDNPSSITWVSETTKWYGLIGYGFMDLLRMLVIPLVFVAIIRVIINLKNGELLGKLTVRSVLMLIGTTAIAAIIAIIVGNIFKLGLGSYSIIGEGVQISEIKEIVPIVDTLRGLIPSNPMKAMVDTNVVAIIIFAGFIGVAVTRLNKKHATIMKPFVDLIEALFKIVISIAMTLMKLMPYAIIALLANTIAGRGLNAIIEALSFTIALYISCILMFFVHLLIVSLNGLNPWLYMKKVMEPLLLAFTSRSSMGTLPVTIKTLTEKVGVENGTASFIGSVGASGGLNGCAGVYPALVAIFVANMTGTPMNFTFYVMLIVIIALGSFGIVGLPGTATMAVSVLLSGLGMGEHFALVSAILAIDPILDMARTCLNVNGTMTTAVTVAKSLKQLDKDVFNGKKTTNLE